MADLVPRSIDVDGLVMGSGTSYVITRIEAKGKPDGSSGDVSRPREDGAFFGVDRLDGRLVSVELTIDTESYADCQEAWRTLLTVWDAERVRRTPGAVLPMRIRQFDGEERWVVGRPNRIDPVDESLMNLGRLDVQLDFRCIDHRFYGPERTQTLSIVPRTSGGLRSPLTDPLTTFTGAETGVAIGLEVGGDVPAYIQALIYGPITRPQVFAPNQWTAELDIQLVAGTDNVMIDSQPWSRRVRKNGIANVSGKLTQSSPYLSQMVLPPGLHDVLLRGIDETGTSYMILTWRDAYLAL